MKNLKFSLSNIEGKLTRQQMRNILGGSGRPGGPQNDCVTATKIQCHYRRWKFCEDRDTNNCCKLSCN